MWQRLGSAPPSETGRTASAALWEVIATSVKKVTVSSTKSSPASTSPIRISNPGIYGQGDCKAGAACDTGGEQTQEIAAAIKSQTTEIASLVKSHAENSALPAGTLKRLNRQSEELVYLVRACNQYSVAVAAGEQGQAFSFPRKWEPPVKFEDWEARARRQNEIWAPWLRGIRRSLTSGP